MKTLYVASEAFPFVKTGGLGDVAGSLPVALGRLRVATRVVLPLYESIEQEWRDQMTFLRSLTVPLSWRNLYCGIFELKYNNIKYYFLDNEYYFKRATAYGFFDDAERFGFFCRAVVELLDAIGWFPDVVHVNDWQSALVPVYLKEKAKEDSRYEQIKTLITIHNIEYQGGYSRDILGDVFGLPDEYYLDGTLRMNDHISLLKGGMMVSDYVNTVSRTYASELQYPYYAQGLEGVVRLRGDRFSGILNGIDTDSYNPATDQMICENYTPDTLHEKLKNKTALQKQLGLNIDENIPVIGMVTRLASHKGLDLVTSVFERMLNLGVQFVLVGTGDDRFERFFRWMNERFPGSVSATIAFSEQLARRIYAGCDIFLMPSQKEPCGLSQMIAMRYGALPVVRETGGLCDTVQGYGGEDESGFVFPNYSAEDMFGEISRAVDAYRNDRWHWDEVALKNMKTDFSWAKSAKEYKKLYSEMCDKK